MLYLLQINFSENIELTKNHQYISYNILCALQKQKIKNKRINIEFTVSDNPINPQNYIIGLNDSICNVDSEINLNVDDIEKCIALRICDILAILFTEQGMDTTFISDLKMEISSGMLLREMVFMKKSKSADKLYSGEVVCRYLPEYVEFIFRGTKKGEESFDVIFYKALLLTVRYTTQFNKSYWLGNDFVIEDSFGEMLTVFSLVDKNYKVNYKPINHSPEFLEKYYKSLSFNTSTEEFLKINAEYMNW